jgi:hypothetical protein
MKKIIILAISILFVSVSCDKEEEGNSKPTQLNATDGFAVGCIHIDFEKDPNVDYVFLERREKGAENWEMITSTGLTSFDEIHGYPNTGGMPPGKVFEYRIKNGWPEDAPYSDIEEGYAYDIIPVTEIDISTSGDKASNLLTWNEENNGTFINESEIYFDVYRSEDSLGTYSKIAKVDEDRSYFDQFPPSLIGKDIFYRIDVYYNFHLNLPSGGNHWETTTPVQGTVVRALSSSSENPTVDYSATELGQIVQASQGGIPTLLEKKVNGSMYVGLLNNAGATGYGIPELYKLNGTSWSKEWTANPPNEFNKVNYAIASSSQFLAGVQDSLCVYEWNGSAWGNNIAPDNLGQADGPSSVTIEVSDDNLYMAITQHPNYDLQVLKYNGSSWDTIGGDANGIIASGTISDITIEEINNTLYLHYLIDNTLHIKHLDGTAWQSDLSWSNDNVLAIDLAASGNDLYFTTETNNSGYLGGVYKVTSTSTTEEIILGSNTSEDSFKFPESITIDTDGNLIVVSFNYNTSTASFYPNLKLYDGTDWKTISGDFSDGIDPAIVSAVGTDLIYVYGDGVSENGAGDPTIIKSKKMTKQ